MKKLLEYLAYAFVLLALTLIGLVGLALTVILGVVMTALIYIDLFCETLGEVTGRIRKHRDELAWHE